MALDFPSLPSDNTYYLANGVYYLWDNTKSLWRVVDTSSNFTLFDASTLEGEAGAYYLNYNNFTNTPNITTTARLALSVTGDITYDNSTGVIGVNPYLDTVGGVTGNVSNEQLGLAVVQAGFLDTYNVIESTNLYFTNSRVQTYLEVVDGNILPSESETKSLGSHTYRWANLYLSGNSIFLGNVVLKNVGGIIKVGEVEANGYIVPSFSGLAPITTVNGEIGDVVLTTANINETSNLYYTDSRVYSNVSLLGFDTTSNVTAAVSTAVNGANTFVKESVANSFMIVALSDEITAIEAGERINFRAPYALNLFQTPRASLNTTSDSGVVIVDIKVDGTSILSSNIEIDAGNTTSLVSTNTAALSTTTIAEDAKITMDVVEPGGNATGLKVTIFYNRVF